MKHGKYGIDTKTSYAMWVEFICNIRYRDIHFNMNMMFCIISLIDILNKIKYIQCNSYTPIKPLLKNMGVNNWSFFYRAPFLGVKF